LVLPAGALMFATVAWVLLDPARLAQLMSEEGAVEQLNGLLWFAAALAFALFARPDDLLSTRVSMVIMLVAFGARELDLHKTLTGKSVLKVSFYLERFPLHHKLVALVVLAVIFGALVLLFKRYARQVWSGFRAGDVVCTTVVIFVVIMAATKVLDRAINVLLADFAVVTPASLGALIGSIEESLEAALPLIASLGLAQHLGRQPQPSLLSAGTADLTS
jgi:hypothetical protein